MGLICLVLLPITQTLAQGTKLPKRIFIQGNAMGTSTQLGRLFSINIWINELSTAEDQKILLDAFKAKGNEGLVNAVSKMSSKGRIAITGTVGYDVNYIRRFKQPDGTTMLRMVTDRPITFGEAWSDTRSSDYNLSAVEIIVALDKKTGAEIWRVERAEATNWATPYIWEHDGKAEIVTPGTKKVRSYDLDGKLLWEFGGMSSITIMTPFTAHGLLYISSGYVGDAALAARVADAMLAEGVYVIAFSFPVVPRGRARIRVQLSAAHNAEDVQTCVRAFVAARAAVAAD
jgi:outer membrane protein assembly factor BamB